jgi:hypothetical protein
MHPEPPEEPQLTRSDIRLFEQAFAREWPMSPDVRSRILERLIRLFDEGAATNDHTVVAAFRALAVANNSNLTRELIHLRERELEWKMERERLRGKLAEDPTETMDPADAKRMLRALLNEPDPDRERHGESPERPADQAGG